MSKKNPSRADRFAEAIGLVSDAKAIIEELMEELQNWKDSLPENLQNGSKADQLDSAICELDDCVQNLDTVEGSSPEFPGMFG